MTAHALSSGWVHYAFWGFDHGLARARRGMFGQRAVAKAPEALEESVRTGGTDGKRMVLRTLIWCAVTYLVLGPLLVGWLGLMEYALHSGVDGQFIEAVNIAGRWALTLTSGLCYLLLVLGPFRRSMAGLRDARQAVLALESMPAQERASWVGEYRSEPRPACSILEKRSAEFRSLVAEAGK